MSDDTLLLIKDLTAANIALQNLAVALLRTHPDAAAVENAFMGALDDPLLIQPPFSVLGDPDFESAVERANQTVLEYIRKLP